MTPWASIAILLPSLPSAGAPAPLHGKEAAAEAERGIDAGVEFLLASLKGPAGWTPEEKYPSGYAAVQLYALLKCGVTYRHPTLQKGLAIIQGSRPEKVYSVSLDIMAHGAILQELEEEAMEGRTVARADLERFRRRMEESTNWLVGARLRGKGVWTYERPAARKAPPKSFDHSNSQFAILALGVAAEKKIKVPEEVWEEIADHFIQAQDREGVEVSARPTFREDAEERAKAGKVRGRTTTVRKVHPLHAGEDIRVRARGWRYTADGTATTFSMTCAGLSSLLLAQRNLPRAWLDGPRGAALLSAIRDGCGWIAEHHGDRRKPGDEPYALYSLEKAGDLGDVEAFGDFRWYEESARALLRLQHKDGSWGPPGNEAKRKSDTSLALLFLARATALGARSGPVIQVTGSGGERGRDSSAPSWIYIPSLEGEISLVRLFRLLRHRPGRRVLRLVEEAAIAVDPQRIDILVPHLAGALRSPWPEAQEFAAKLLGRLTGLDSRDASSFEAWARRWREVGRIGEMGKAAGAGEAEELRGWLGPEQGTPLRRKVLWALGRIGARSALGDIVELLEDGDPLIRKAAHGALSFISGQSLPFHPQGSEETRREESRAWREWVANEPR